MNEVYEIKFTDRGIKQTKTIPTEYGILSAIEIFYYGMNYHPEILSIKRVG